RAFDCPIPALPVLIGKHSMPSRRSILAALFFVIAPILHAADYDVVVYVRVPCRIAAAIASQREGARTLLIEPTKHVGGLNTSGLNTAETEHMLKWTFGGIALELYERLGKHYGMSGPGFYFGSSVVEKQFTEMLAEAKVPVRFGLRVDKVEKDGARIRRIVLSDGSS